jgi:hypothetical protein
MNEDETPLFEDIESWMSHILRVARERAEVAYLEAKRAGTRDPVVFLWVHDDNTTSHDPEIVRVRQEAAERERLPLSIKAVERDDLRRGLIPINPDLSQRLSQPSRELPFTIVLRAKRRFMVYDFEAPQEV